MVNGSQNSRDVNMHGTQNSRSFLRKKTVPTIITLENWRKVFSKEIGLRKLVFHQGVKRIFEGPYTGTRLSTAKITVESRNISGAENALLIIFLIFATSSRIIFGTFSERLQLPGENLSTYKKRFFVAKRFKYSGRNDLGNELLTSGVTERMTDKTREKKES